MPESSPDAEICIVDDDISVRRSLSRLISLEGWTVRCFATGEDFLDFARHHRVRLALVDLCMPGIGGLQVLSAVRDFSPGTRVIIITAGNDEAVRDCALEQGAAAFLFKPFGDSALLSAIKYRKDLGASFLQD